MTPGSPASLRGPVGGPATRSFPIGSDQETEQTGQVAPSARFEEVKIRLREPVHGLEELSGVLGIPEWWPTGSRVAVVIAHSSSSDMNDPVVERLHRELTEHRYLSLRFNFPFAEAGKRASSDSPAVLESAYRAALAVLGRDPSAAPAHLFLAGKGLGAKVAAQLSTARIHADGLFLLSYPLHTQDRPEEIHAEHLYRIVAPLLFVQGTRDRQCDVEVLRRALARIGAPTRLEIVDEADQNFRVLKKSERTEEEVLDQVVAAVRGWLAEQLGEV